LHYFEEAARIGVSKINVNSDLRYAFRTTLEEQLAENPDEFAVMKLMDAVKDAIQKVVEEKIEAFGSANRAVL
jgi:fructose-bisphosphate aldolase class II